MTINGVFPPIASPFDDHGRLAISHLVDNVARWGSTGLAGYVIGGSNGESAFLETDDLCRMVSAVREAASQEKLIIAGTGRESTLATIRLTQAAADAGAHAALVMTPHFFGGQMTSQVFIRHYERVADAAPIPILIYNVPKFTRVNIDAPTVASLAQHPNIVGVKDSAGDIAQIVDLIRLCPGDFSVLIGNGPAFLSGLQLGATGGILALANVAPAECVAIYNLVSEGRMEEALAIHLRLMPVTHTVFGKYGISGLKAALDALGYYGGPPREPLLTANGDARTQIETVLRATGLLCR